MDDVALTVGASVTPDAVMSDTSIPFPATFTIELANQLRAEGNAFSFNFYSDAPFPGRRNRTLDSFEQAALTAIMSGET